MGVGRAQLVQAGQDLGVAVAQAAVHPTVGAASAGDVVVPIVAILDISAGGRLHVGKVGAAPFLVRA